MRPNHHPNLALGDVELFYAFGGGSGTWPAAQARNVKTLHLIDSLGPGGAERSLAELVGHLRSNGAEPTVAHFERTSDGVEPIIHGHGVEVVHLPVRGWTRRVRAVRALLRARQPDVLHTTLFNADIVGRVSAFGLPVALLTSIVNTSYDPIRLTDPRVRRWRLATARVLDCVTGRLRVDSYHAISQAVADAAVRDLRVAADAITVIPRGRDRTRLGFPSTERTETARGALGVTDHRTSILLNVGREDFQKGKVVLLQAFQRLAEGRDDLLLVTAGRRGNASADLDALLASAGQLPVRRLGHTEDIPELLAAADAFVFPSLYEGLGGAILEAMALEAPIVASDLPAIREVVADDGVLVPPGDPAALARALEEVLTNPEAARIRARSAQRRFDDSYEGTAVASRMIDLFQQVADHAARRRTTPHWRAR